MKANAISLRILIKSSNLLTENKEEEEKEKRYNLLISGMREVMSLQIILMLKDNKGTL